MRKYLSVVDVAWALEQSIVHRLKDALKAHDEAYGQDEGRYWWGYSEACRDILGRSRPIVSNFENNPHD